jgi:hypothetical protein
VLFVGTATIAGCDGGKAVVSTSTATTTTTNVPPVAVASTLRPVPLRTQRAIKRSVFSEFAYVPTQMLVGYRYYQWKTQASAGGGQFVNIWFRRRNWPDITYTAGSKQYSCPGGRTVWAQGGKIYWSGNNENDQYAWVCLIDSSGHAVQLVVDAAPLNKGGPTVASLAAILHSSRALR